MGKANDQVDNFLPFPDGFTGNGRRPSQMDGSKPVACTQFLASVHSNKSDLHFTRTAWLERTTGGDRWGDSAMFCSWVQCVEHSRRDGTLTRPSPPSSKFLGSSEIRKFLGPKKKCTGGEQANPGPRANETRLNCTRIARTSPCLAPQFISVAGLDVQPAHLHLVAFVHEAGVLPQVVTGDAVRAPAQARSREPVGGSKHTGVHRRSGPFTRQDVL